MVQPDMPHCWSFDSSYSEIECMSLFFSNSLLERISSLSDEMADARRMVAFQQMLLDIAGNDGKRSVGRMADDVEQRLGRIRVYINCN